MGTGKKPVLSDLKDLGRLYREAETSMPDSCQGTRHLSVGDRIVLMDSNLYGYITRLGSKVSVRLDEGLDVDLEYGEFAVVRAMQVKALIKAPVRKKDTGVTSVPHPGGYRDNITVDLHIETLARYTRIPACRELECQMSMFRRTLENNLCHRGMKITFIHGIGEGILRNMIQKELGDVYALRCTWVSRPGMTVVTVK